MGQGVDYRLFAVDDCWGGYAGKPGTGGKYDFAAVEDYCQRIEHTGDRFVPVESCVEQRTGDAKKPMLSDLRESGAIEQDADMVLFIHRPERYGIMEDSMGNSLKGIADIIIAKHRNGAVGEIQLRFRNELAQFCDLEEVSPFASGGSTVKTVTFGSRMNEDAAPQMPQLDSGSTSR